VILLVIQSVSLSAIHLRLDHPDWRKLAAKAGNLRSRRGRDKVGDQRTAGPTERERQRASRLTAVMPVLTTTARRHHGGLLERDSLAPGAERRIALGRARVVDTAELPLAAPDHRTPEASRG
jgi:hypothetical protein